MRETLRFLDGLFQGQRASRRFFRPERCLRKPGAHEGQIAGVLGARRRPGGRDALAADGRSRGEQPRAGRGHASGDGGRRKAHQAFGHTGPVLLRLVGGHAFSEQGLGALEVAQVQTGVPKIAQHGGQVAVRADFAQQRCAFLVSGFGRRIILFAARQIAEGVQCVPGPKRIARLRASARLSSNRIRAVS